jgi:alpha-glucosidase
MNYWFREIVISLLSQRIRPEQAISMLALMAREYPKGGLLRSWNMIGSHDTVRVKNLLGPRARLAFLLAFTSPGVPLVYYGDEVGMEGGADPDNRRPMIRDGWDREMLAHIKALADLRREKRAFREGAFLPLEAPGLLAFARTTDNPRETLLVFVNPTAERQAPKVFVPRTELFDAIQLVGPRTGHRTQMHGGALEIALEAGEGVVLAPLGVEPSGYDFMKRVDGF